MSNNQTMCGQGSKGLKYNTCGLQYLCEKSHHERLVLPSWCHRLPGRIRRLPFLRRCKHDSVQWKTDLKHSSHIDSIDTQLLSPLSRDCLGDDCVDYDIENIVISGGGTKGYSVVGALKVRTSSVVDDSTDTCKQHSCHSNACATDTEKDYDTYTNKDDSDDDDDDDRHYDHDYVPVYRSHIDVTMTKYYFQNDYSATYAGTNLSTLTLTQQSTPTRTHGIHISRFQKLITLLTS